MKVQIDFNTKREDRDYVKAVADLKIEADTRDDLVKAQHLINGLLQMLPADNSPLDVLPRGTLVEVPCK